MPAGAYIHIGAIIGTIMAGNVFFGIIPSQKALVEAVQERRSAPDPAYGLNAKLRSTHNTYTTLPILFIMISNHYPITYNHEYNWLVLVGIIVSHRGGKTVLCVAPFRQSKSRQFTGRFGYRHRGAGTMLGQLLPKATGGCTAGSARTAQAIDLVTGRKNRQWIRCGTCHADKPTDDIFKVAPGGVVFDNMQTISRWAGRIKARSVDCDGHAA